VLYIRTLMNFYFYRRILGLGIVLTLLQSCISIYVPTTPSPTNFEKRNDVAGKISFTRGSYHVNAAYAPIKHLYIASEFTVSPLTSGGQYYRYAGIGIGTWKHFNNKKYQLELQAGYGYGKTNYLSNKQNTNTLWQAGGPYNNFYQSVFFTKKQNEDIKHGFCFRANEISLTYRKTNDDFKYLKDKTFNFLIFEPSYYAKYTFVDYFSLFGSVGMTFSNGDKTKNINYNLINVRLGLEFNLY